MQKAAAQTLLKKVYHSLENRNVLSDCVDNFWYSEQYFDLIYEHIVTQLAVATGRLKNSIFWNISQNYEASVARAGLTLGQACQLRQIVTAGGRGPIQIQDAKYLFNPFLTPVRSKSDPLVNPL